MVQNSVIEASVVASPPSHTPEASKESERKKKEKRKEKQKRKSKDKDKKAVVSEGFTSNNLASPASPALSPTPATPTTPATRPSLPPTPFGVGSTSSVGPTLTGTPTTSSYLSPLKSVSQKSNVASSTISANSTAPTLSPRSQPQKHILFDPEEGEVPDAQPTDSQPQQGPPEGGSQVLRTSVFLRPAPRPTIENWKSSGWRTYSGYSKQMQRKETKEQSEKGKRKRSRGNKQGSLQHTDNQQSQAEEANHTASCQTTSIGGNENEPAMEVSVKDYESFPKLDAPSVGICLAYKILEVSSSWRPEVSDWKEAKVISLNEQGTILTLEHLNLPPPPPPETEEEEEVVETTWDVNWSEMQDVRLINK
uniref:Coilin tudor domain-containing protein n=1 Tax=Arcella intermedia TaxID=1963864 RepID=A0A6B2L6Y8_9EUKA